MTLRHLTLDQFTIRGERALRGIGVYTALKKRLVRDRFVFRVPEEGSVQANADRVLFLNLTYWNAGENSDVLVDASIDADVVAHTAWHHVANAALAGQAAPGAPTAAAMFLGESVASAFDVYLIGHMLRSGQRTAFLSTQVPAMSAAAYGAGLDETDVAALLASVAAEPDRAFEALRELLFDACLALVACPNVDAAYAALDTFRDRPFVGLLHHFEISNWVLHARAYAAPPAVGGAAEDPAVVMDRALRAAPNALEWLEAHWLGAAP